MPAVMTEENVVDLVLATGTTVLDLDDLYGLLVQYGQLSRLRRSAEVDAQLVELSRRLNAEPASLVKAAIYESFSPACWMERVHHAADHAEKVWNMHTEDDNIWHGVAENALVLLTDLEEALCAHWAAAQDAEVFTNGELIQLPALVESNSRLFKDTSRYAATMLSAIDTTLEHAVHPSLATEIYEEDRSINMDLHRSVWLLRVVQAM